MMLYVALGHACTTATMNEIRARRLEFHYAPEVNVLGEYWLFNDSPSLVAVFETESATAIMTALAYFDGVMVFEIFPAVTADEGLKLTREMIGKTAVPA